MRKRDRKEKTRDKNIQHRGNANELSNNYDLLMKLARRQPKLYYSEEGGVKAIK